MIRISRSARASAAGVAIVLALAGCATPAGPGAAPSTTAPAPATSAPAETPTPTPSATPAPDPGDISAWVITEEAIGPFELGMPWDEAVALADELGWDLQYAHQEEGCAANVGLPDTDGPGGLGLRVWKGDGVVYDLTLSDDGGLAEGTPVPETAEGITLFSPLDQVRAAYPGATEGEVVPTAERRFVSVDADGQDGAIHFEHFVRQEGVDYGTDGPVEGIVRSVSVNAVGQPAYEHC
ncbi:hypothetical protein [Microbacterium lacusdiani]